MSMLINLGGLGLVGTIGCATVQVGDSCRCISFVRGPSQLTGNDTSSGAGELARNCATGEVHFTVVRAPFAVRKRGNAFMDDFGGSSGGGLLAPGVLKDERIGVVSASSDPLTAMVQRAVDRCVMHEALPLAKFELVVQVLSSTDDHTDLQCITAAACAALVDGSIKLRDIFGAASFTKKSSFGSSSSGGNDDIDDDDDDGAVEVHAVVMAHSGDPLGIQSTGSFVPEELCAAVEKCCQEASSLTRAAFQAAAGRAVEVKKKQQQAL